MCVQERETKRKRDREETERRGAFCDFQFSTSKFLILEKFLSVHEYLCVRVCEVWLTVSLVFAVQESHPR